MGHPRAAAAPDRRARRRPARRPGPVRGPRPDRGASRSTSTSGPGSRSSTWPPPTPTTTSCSTRGARSRRSRRPSTTGSRRCWGRRATMTVWDDLVGQHRVIEALRAAAGGHGMSHAWLFTGPPGSGRSNAAVAFAAALAVRARAGSGGRLRRLPRVPHRARRFARRRDGGPHREALDRRRRGPRPGPPLGAGAVRTALAGDHRRGRRPAHRAGLQRPAQGDRGADRAHRLDALRADRRGRPPDDPLAVPPGHADHADHRGRRGVPGPHRRRAGVAGVVRRPRQPGPHRPGPRAGPRREHPQPPPRGGLLPRQADLAGRLHDRGRQPRRGDQGGGRRGHQRARRPREGRPRRGLRRGGAGPPPARVRAGALRAGARASAPAPSGATSTWSTAG